MQRWIELEGVVNMRDLGGLPTLDGREVQPRRLIRSDNLQDLSPSSVAHVVDELGVTDVIDLRSNLEREVTGEGPLRVAGLRHHHHSLIIEDADQRRTVETAMAFSFEDDGVDREPPVRDAAFWSRHYTGYITTRPDSLVAALDAISRSAGGAIVHCAAGKDRTGTVVALALDVAGVPQEEIVADYVLSAERIERIIGRLIDVEPYRRTLPSHTLDEQRPRAEAMSGVLGYVREEHGDAEGWLRAQGWAQDDVDRLRSRLLD